jgi:hypothetical protein
MSRDHKTGLRLLALAALLFALELAAVRVVTPGVRAAVTDARAQAVLKASAVAAQGVARHAVAVFTPAPRTLQVHPRADT